MPRFLCCLVCIFFLSTAFSESVVKPEPVRFTQLPVFWRVKIFNFFYLSGTFLAEGTLMFDQQYPQKSHIRVVIYPDSVATHIPLFDTILKSSHFFNIKKYPRATFISDQVRVISPTIAEVHGILTLRGVAKPVMLNATLSKNTATALYAMATIQRSDFGMHAHQLEVSDEVQINISLRW